MENQTKIPRTKKWWARFRRNPRDEKIAQLSAENAKLRGDYYALIDEIWDKKEVEYSGASAEIMGNRRKNADALLAWYDSRPRKVRANSFPERTLVPGDDNGAPGLAHIIPKDRTCSQHWGRAVNTATGFFCRNGDHKNCLDSDSLRHFIQGRRADKEKQIEAIVGIKAAPLNFLKLPKNHFDHFDHLVNGKGLIITPIWNVEDAWTPGTPYSLLVIPNSQETMRWMNLMGKDGKGEDPWVSGVYASDEEMSIGTKFLQLSVRALADELDSDNFFSSEKTSDKDYRDLLQHQNSSVNDIGSQHSRPSGSSPKSLESATTPDVREFKAKLDDLKAAKSELQSTGEVSVPFVKQSGVEKPVLKIDLAKYFQDDQGRDYSHSIPDPFLVGLKAAVNWSALMCFWKLLPACGCVARGKDADEELVSLSEIEEITISSPHNDDDISVVSFDSLPMDTVQRTDKNAAVVSPDSKGDIQ